MNSFQTKCEHSVRKCRTMIPAAPDTWAIWEEYPKAGSREGKNWRVPVIAWVAIEHHREDLGEDGKFLSCDVEYGPVLLDQGNVFDKESYASEEPTGSYRRLVGFRIGVAVDTSEEPHEGTCLRPVYPCSGLVKYRAALLRAATRDGEQMVRIDALDPVPADKIDMLPTKDVPTYDHLVKTIKTKLVKQLPCSFRWTVLAGPIQVASDTIGFAEVATKTPNGS